MLAQLANLCRVSLTAWIAAHLFAVLMFLGGCGDSGDSGAAQTTDAGRDGGTFQSQSDANVADGRALDECPASGEPAMRGCPCHRPPGDYCCWAGTGIACNDDGLWGYAFHDGICGPQWIYDEDLDAGGYLGDSTADEMECELE